ncbi:MAG: iron-sulfur cluster loop [Proteobacteria bacterium]|nr:iron-sulfur cluster loop [Pseudomonadota bacterium]
MDDGTPILTLAAAHAGWAHAAKGRPLPADLTDQQRSAIEALIRLGEERLQQVRVGLDFETGDSTAEIYLNDIQTYPHLFLLGCVMDRQIKSGRAWLIPYIVGQHLGGWSFAAFEASDPGWLTMLFRQERLHRFPEGMAKCFHSAIERIARRYDGNAANIWAPGSSSAGILRRLLEFDGIGLKIANMAVNILARDFRIAMTEYSSIDIAPDSRVANFFQAHGLLTTNKREEIIYLARELYPWYPGMLDIGAWEWERRA